MRLGQITRFLAAAGTVLLVAEAAPAFGQTTTDLAVTTFVLKGDVDATNAPTPTTLPTTRDLTRSSGSR